MTDEEKKSVLATQLLLLFDGKAPIEVAGAVYEALGDNSRDVSYYLDQLNGVNVGVSLTPSDIHIEIENRNEWGDDGEQYTYVGTEEQLKEACLDHYWGENDYWQYEREDLFNRLMEQGLIVRSISPDFEDKQWRENLK